MLADSIDLTPPLGWTLSDQQTSERLTALLGIRRLRKHPSLSLSLKSLGEISPVSEPTSRSDARESILLS